MGEHPHYERPDIKKVTESERRGIVLVGPEYTESGSWSGSCCF